MVNYIDIFFNLFIISIDIFFKILMEKGMGVRAKYFPTL